MMIERAKKILWKCVKYAFILGALVLLCVTVLANLGGNQPIYQETIEEYLTEQSGMRTRIIDFGRLQFFPDLAVEGQEIEFYNSDAQKNMFVEPVVTVRYARMGMWFWDVLLHNGHFKDLTLRQMQMQGGVLLPHPVQIAQAQIIDDAYVIEGFIGNTPFDVQVSLLKYGARSPSYRFDLTQGVTVSLGALTGRFYLSYKPGNDLYLKTFTISDMKDEEKPKEITGEMGVRYSSGTGFDFDGEIDQESFNFSVALEHDDVMVSGDMPENLAEIIKQIIDLMGYNFKTINAGQSEKVL